MKLKLFNTLTRWKEEFRPLEDSAVRLYTCGLTVYGPAHLGNLRAYIFTDTLRRVLVANGYAVRHVMNVTDVGHMTSDMDEGEDKMERSAKATKMSAWDVAKKYTDLFLSDLKDLNILLPDVMPKATEHIPEQISLIKKLETKGYTYRISDGVYFDTSKVADYGKLANLKEQSLKAGARIEVNPEKRNPSDFALWKLSQKNEKRQMEWPSPWGAGFPGWHIECSAMSMRYLGETFDIHTGGIDHIPVHHTNEIAQSESATGKPFVNVWMHNEFLVDEEGKISKSRGAALSLQALKDKKYSPLAFRYFCLNTHYRKPLAFTWKALDAAQSAYRSLVEMVRSWPAPKIGCAEFEKHFADAVNDDLNTPRALGILWELLRSNYPDEAKHRSVLQFDKVLGLGLDALTPLVIPANIKKLVAEREKARAAKDFAESDGLRKFIEKEGWAVEDTPGGPVVKSL